MAQDLAFPFRRVLLWSAPRSCSTLFERSIRQLRSVKVLWEPHIKAYYYGPERTRDNSHQPTQSELDDGATYEAVDTQLLKCYNDYEAVFAKNFPYYIQGRYKHYTSSSFSLFKHTFLIRNPAKSIPSLVQSYKKCRLDSIGLEDNGIKELHEFFRFVQSNLDPHPIVVDADDLLENPRGIMERYCNETGLPFNESMLTWEPGEVKDWMWYRYSNVFLDVVINSSGFIKQERKPEKVGENLPIEAQELIKEMQPYYNAMYKERLQLTA